MNWGFDASRLLAVVHKTLYIITAAYQISHIITAVWIAFIKALIFGFSVGFLASELRAGNEVRVGS